MNGEGAAIVIAVVTVWIVVGVIVAGLRAANPENDLDMNLAALFAWPLLGLRSVVRGIIKLARSK